jgi:hypothetical protein
MIYKFYEKPCMDLRDQTWKTILRRFWWSIEKWDCGCWFITKITTVRLSFSWLRFRFDKIGVLSLSGLFSISISQWLFKGGSPLHGGFPLYERKRVSPEWPLAGTIQLSHHFE